MHELIVDSDSRPRVNVGIQMVLTLQKETAVGMPERTDQGTLPLSRRCQTAIELSLDCSGMIGPVDYPRMQMRDFQGIRYCPNKSETIDERARALLK
jgi:hypothetical protein